jgi:molybdenum cofactor biosynthesis enzyme MoaA
MRGGWQDQADRGEPLARKNTTQLFELLSPHPRSGDLGEVTPRTNGTFLSRYAVALATRQGSGLCDRPACP